MKFFIMLGLEVLTPLLCAIYKRVVKTYKNNLIPLLRTPMADGLWLHTASTPEP
jgi:hypothetical protein